MNKREILEQVATLVLQAKAHERRAEALRLNARVLLAPRAYGRFPVTINGCHYVLTAYEEAVPVLEELDSLDNFTDTHEE